MFFIKLNKITFAIINNLFYWISQKVENIYKDYQLLKITKNKSIKIGSGTFIHVTATIEIVNGGTVKIGNNCQILNGVVLITYGGNINIGDNCIISPYTIIYGLGGAMICDDVLIAGHTIVVPDNHIFDDIMAPINKQGSKQIGIKINSNVWIGHGCSILDGVEIESGAIIAAGSVVNKNVASNTIVGGVPIKLIKERN